MGNRNKIYLNTFVPLAAQLVTMLCGFVLPRLILTGFGSEVNGAASSITQFLGIINFFDLGVTAVFQSALYKPLAARDKKGLSETVAAADRFFRHIGILLVSYILGLCIFFPLLSKGSFDSLFWVTLILAMGVNSFGQYYLGVVDRIVLIADQKYYLTAIVQTITLLISTVLNVILINNGASIQIVKFTTSIVFLIRPFFYRIYVRKHYQIDRKIKYQGEPLKQKWNGVTQHISAVVLEGTDTIVLTLFSTLVNVSIYHMYYLVVSAVKTVFLSMTNAVAPYVGKLWAQNNVDRARAIYNYYEWLINAVTTLIFGCTSTLIVPFILIYTKGVNDANYDQPLFALLLTIAFALNCLRLPYTSMVNATGRYKQTQHIYLIAVILNIVVSIATVLFWGLIGVTIGTLVSLGYQTIHMSIYNSREVFQSKQCATSKIWLVDAVIFLSSYFICGLVQLSASTYFEWIKLAVVHFIIWLFISAVVWSITYKPFMNKSITTMIEMAKVKLSRSK